MGMLDNKTAIITGASKGIGLAIAELFASEGADLILISRDLSKLVEVKEMISAKNTNRQIHIYKADVRHQEELIAVFKDLNEKKISADILVNNAGIMIDSTLQMVKPEQIDAIYGTNVYGTIFCSQLATKLFIRKRKGSIINMSSIIGTNGNLGQSIYGSSKTAIIGFTKSLSKELASLNIRVNALAPGFIDTDMTKGMNEKFYEKNLASIGMRRIGKPEDIAKVALFLASDLSEYVTGQVIGVDGGMVI
jgi:3-oxoacyl-[acyl-carrier protein] reductase